jgi:hypothetical protein
VVLNACRGVRAIGWSDVLDRVLIGEPESYGSLPEHA